MKEGFLNIVLFIVFALLFSGFSACNRTDGSQNAATNSSNSSNVISNAQTGDVSTDKSSEYPPLNASIAQAEIELVDGTSTKVSDRKGKVVLLNLWGIWCIPCIAEMPHLVKMQDEYREKGFEIIGLNVGNEDTLPEKIENIKQFASKQGLNYELARIPDNFAQDFMKLTKFGGVPQTILIDREGRLRGVFLGGGPATVKQMEETVSKVVNE